jgi:shikimate kinase
MSQMEDKEARIAEMLDRPIVLVGLMGAGKTRFGRQLAKRLGVRFYDSDAEIEKAAGMKVAEIFEKFGEPYFRDGERRVMERLLGESRPRIIATGGGAIMNEETAAHVWDKTVSIWLKADISVLAARVGANRKRPLLKGGGAEDILSGLAERRYSTYGKADIVIDSSENTPAETVDKAIEALYGFICIGEK